MKQRGKGGATVSDLTSKLERDDSIGTHFSQVKPRVMVVDDEPTNIRVLSEALKNDMTLSWPPARNRRWVFSIRGSVPICCYWIS